MAGSGDSTRAILFALGANFAIAVSKGVAAFFTGSSAMLAETVHSLADCGNQLLLLLGMKQAKRPPSPDYPLGYGKAIYFWSFLVALMLFSVGGMFSVYEGFHKLHDPEPLKQWWWAVGVLVFGIVAEAASMRACMQEVNKARGGRSLWRWFRESRQAELVVIFGEDLAALLGLVFALFAVVLSVVTGNPVWDAIGTLAIGVLLIVVAVFVAIEVKALLIGQSVDGDLQAEIRSFIEGQPQVEKVLSLITLQLGNDVMVSVQAVMQERPSMRALVEDINRIETAMKAKFSNVRWSFFEPEIEDRHRPDQDYISAEAPSVG
ncbi:cation diffusion facilitator family transporter [Lysobacter sp. CFH 32150]|uniref:cation diffusion facilitator family transporter n=1 Tax=Lysobacter sp. CFH 32150 TaxID=2927128 RepID=UPI001FA818A2|nr:cation diffusion facilitator family transporter [Lysobacter sp. CFH 32150]MCI4567511.1 cation diffusion facilitator family transporter [Lysobacter sp. CFH 32150]